MWAVIPAPIPAPIPIEVLRRRIGFISVSYSKPLPRSYERISNISPKSKSKPSESEPVMGLGREIIMGSGDSMTEEKKMSGSDVILALQRAAAQRKRTNADKKTMMKKKKKTGGVVELLSSTGESTEDNGVDYNNVRPLRIKSDWGRKLDEFQKLLKDFEEMGL